MNSSSQARVRQALEKADLGTLRIALFQATRDPEIAAMVPEPQTVRGGAGVTYQLPEKYRISLVDKGVHFLTNGLNQFEKRIPDDEELRELMEMAGDPLDDVEFLARREIPALDPFPWAAKWHSGATRAARWFSGRDRRCGLRWYRDGCATRESRHSLSCVGTAWRSRRNLEYQHLPRRPGRYT